MKRSLILLAILLPALSLAADHDPLEVPITFTQDGLVIVHIKINGQPSAVLLDTAATTAVDARLGLAESESRMVETTTAFARSSRRLSYTSPTFDLGGSYLAGYPAMVRNMQSFDRLCGQRISGSLGYDVLRRWKSVTIDYTRRVLVLQK